MDHRGQGEYHCAPAPGAALPRHHKKKPALLLEGIEALLNQCEGLGGEAMRDRIRRHLLCQLLCLGRHTLTGVLGTYDALKAVLSYVSAGTKQVEVGIAGFKQTFVFPILHIWGTHKYKFSLLPSPYLMADFKIDTDLISRTIGDWTDKDDNLTVVVRFGCYRIRHRFGRYEVWRNPADAPLTHDEVLQSMRDKIGRRIFWEQKKITTSWKVRISLALWDKWVCFGSKENRLRLHQIGLTDPNQGALYPPIVTGRRKR